MNLLNANLEPRVFRSSSLFYTERPLASAPAIFLSSRTSFRTDKEMRYANLRQRVNTRKKFVLKLPLLQRNAGFSVTNSRQDSSLDPLMLQWNAGLSVDLPFQDACTNYTACLYSSYLPSVPLHRAVCFTWQHNVTSHALLGDSA